MKKFLDQYLLLPVLLMLAAFSFGGIRTEAEETVYEIDISKLGDEATVQQWKADGAATYSGDELTIYKTPVRVTGTKDGLSLYLKPKASAGASIELADLSCAYIDGRKPYLTCVRVTGDVNVPVIAVTELSVEGGRVETETITGEEKITISGGTVNATNRIKAAQELVISGGEVIVKDMQTDWDANGDTSNKIVISGGTVLSKQLIISDFVTIEGEETHVSVIQDETEDSTLTGLTAVKELLIKGGTVTVDAQHGAGAFEKVSISGGTVMIKGRPGLTGKPIEISGGDVTVVGLGDPAIMVFSSDVTISGGNVTAIGGEGQCAFSVQGTLSFTGGSVIAKSGGEGSTKTPISAKTIIWDGTVFPDGTSGIFSKTPVNTEGEPVEIRTVTFTNGVEIKHYTVAANTMLELPKTWEKVGYASVWKDEEGKEYKPQDQVQITADCTFTQMDSQILAEKIEVSLEKSVLSVGDTTKALAAVTPGNALETGVAWESSDPAVASVTEDGLVKAVGIGTAEIIATAKDGSKVSGKITLEVKAATETEKTPETEKVPETPPPTENIPESDLRPTAIALKVKTKNTGEMEPGGSFSLAPGKKLTIKAAFLPKGIPAESLRYESSNPKIAKVNAKGVVTAAKKSGTATITVSSKSGLKASFKLKVMKQKVTKIKLKAPKKTVKKGKKLTLKATTTPGGKKASKKIYWKTSNKKIATVSQKGVVKAKKKGKVKITAVAADGSGTKASIDLQIK